MRIQVSTYGRHNRYVEPFKSTTVYLLESLAARKILFSASRWKAVENVVIARDLDEYRLMIGIAGLVMPSPKHKIIPTVAAIWVAPEYRRKGVGLALMKEISRICGSRPLMMDKGSVVTTLFCKKLATQGIEISFPEGRARTEID